MVVSLRVFSVLQHCLIEVPGDYDGDKVDVIWDPKIVQPFRNAPVKMADAPPDFEEKNFLRENETVSQFLERVGPDPQAIVRGLQDAQMKSLYEAPIGIYSRSVSWRILSTRR